MAEDKVCKLGNSEVKLGDREGFIMKELCVIRKIWFYFQRYQGVIEVFLSWVYSNLIFFWQ